MKYKQYQSDFYNEKQTKEELFQILSFIMF